MKSGEVPIVAFSTAFDPSDLPGGSVDPLGFEMGYVALADVLLPGLTTIRIFNDPQVTFKSETYIVLMIIAWTYTMHAYYRGKRIEYRYFRLGPKRRIFDRTKHRAQKYWDLDRCLEHCRAAGDRYVGGA